MRPVLDERKCPVQEQVCKAIPACSENAIIYIPDVTRPLGGQIVFDYAHCNGCGVCVEACCGHAINLR
jgi:Pyruvate/2-oxoacid:ferredoxin oxidoreductase delta subunit